VTRALLTNHAHALVCIAQEPGARIRDVAQRLGVTERAAHRIVSDLEADGYVTRHRMGRRNFYEVHPDVPVQNPLEAGLSVGELLAPLLQREPA
jgi:predicted transcriptional regulator